MRASLLHARHRTVCVLVACSWYLSAAYATAQTQGDAAAVESIRSENLAPHLRYLAGDACDGREAGTAGGRRAAQYIRECLNRLPLRGAAADGGKMQPFPPGFCNILALLPGTDEALKRQVVVVCAHYDHVGHGTAENSRGPIGQIHFGADDNASGVSAVLELAAAFARLPHAPRRSILFAFWDAEEKGSLGSRHWTRHPTLPLETVAAAVNLDMIGRLRDHRLTVYGSRTGYGLRRLVSAQNAAIALRMDFSWELEDDADHFSFADRGIPALFLYTGDHNDSHSPRDRADRINWQGLEEVSRLACRLVLDLAERPVLSGFRLASRKETEKDRKRLEHLMPETAGRLDAAWPGNHNTPGVLVSAIRPSPPITQPPLVARSLQLGFAWQTDDAEADTVVLTHVVPHSPAAAAGLKAGDRICQVNGQDFADASGFLPLLASGGRSPQLLVEREGQLHAIRVAQPDVQLVREMVRP